MNCRRPLQPFPLLLLGIFLLAAGVPIASAEQWTRGASKWDRLVGCTLVANGADDGDSFYVRQGGKTFLFRLYTVDTPETTVTYADRVAAQARHFGITSEQTVRAGLEASRFTRRRLAGPFTVETCWQDAKGASPVPRYYAIVTVKGKDLASELAAAGLARVYGFTPEIPGFSLEKVRALERQARTHRLGAYGLRRSSIDAAGPMDPSASRLPTKASRANSLALAPGGRVNINTATAAELEALPGIGSKYAAEIIAGRPYASVEEITRVPGIGSKTLAKLAPYLRAN